MNAREYYDLPYGVGDRLELQRFMTADHYYGVAKVAALENTSEPQTQEEIFTSMVFAMTHNVD